MLLEFGELHALRKLSKLDIDVVLVRDAHYWIFAIMPIVSKPMQMHFFFYLNAYTYRVGPLADSDIKMLFKIYTFSGQK